MPRSVSLGSLRESTRASIALFAARAGTQKTRAPLDISSEARDLLSLDWVAS